MIVTKGISNSITIVALSATMIYCASVGDIKLSSIIATGLLGYIGGIENKSSKRVEEIEPIHSGPISLERKSTFHSVNPEPITTTIGVKQMLPTSKESINNTLAVIALSVTMIYCAVCGDTNLASIISSGLLGYIGGKTRSEMSSTTTPRSPMPKSTYSSEKEGHTNAKDCD